MIPKKILVLSTIPPHPSNGGPSSLLWNCIKVFKQNNNFVEVKIIDESDFALFKRFPKVTRLGICSRKLNFDFSSYDIAFVCPFYLALNISRKDRSKVWVLSVDSASFLFARLFKNSKSFFSKVKYYFLFKWFLYQEKKVTNDYQRVLVVGKNDRLWLNTKISEISSDKIIYLPHPVLEEVIKPFYKQENFHKIQIRPGIKTLVFSGNLSRKYTGNLINEFTPYLKNIHETYKTSILVLGKNNKYIYDYFIKSGITQNIEYINWTKNYLDICNYSKHIHIVPLVSGAGTKNRCLTACALGVSLLTTRVGIENIFYYKPINFIRVSKHAPVMAKHLEFLISKAEKDFSIQDLTKFSYKINKIFSDTLINSLELETKATSE